METLTILTPTYNREKLLLKLYQSLCRQINKDFCWLVVDDGSSDKTYDLITSLKKNAPFRITYLKKENGGKHTAVNYGVKQIFTPLTMIVDSDDYLTDDAIQSIIDINKKYADYENIGSYTFLRGHSDGRKIVSIEKEEFVENYIRYRIKGHRSGDMAEVFKTYLIKKHPFPEFPNEKFISEDIVWIEIGKEYDSVYIDKVIYICEYLKNGLTWSDKIVKFNSPMGSMMRGKMLMFKECGFIENVKGAIIYNCYNEKSEYKQIVGGGNTLYEILLLYITRPLGSYFRKKWKKKKKPYQF